jgi:hypothetical protein
MSCVNDTIAVVSNNVANLLFSDNTNVFFVR